VRYLLILTGGLIAIAAVFLHPIGPGLILVGIIPFDAVLFAVFGFFANALTVTVVLIAAIRLPPGLWFQVWLGTRIQVAMFVFILFLFVSHAMSLPLLGVPTLMQYLRRVTLFAVVGVFTWSLRDPRHVALVVKVSVIGVAIFTVLAVLDFYGGVPILPASRSEWGAEGALGQELTSRTLSRLRFQPPGLPANRYALLLMLPIFLSLGWFMSSDRRMYRMLALGCGVFMTAALVATVSRSGMGGVAIGGLVLLPTVFRVRPAQVVLIAIAGVVLPMLAWLVMVETGIADLVMERFSGEHLGREGGMRMILNVVSFKVFLQHPLLGVGDRAFIYNTGNMMPYGMRDIVPHNSYLGMLAERGLVGSVPYFVLLWMVIRQLLRNHSAASPEVEYWRPFFLAALVAMLAQINLNPLMWSRQIWLVVAFAAALERYETVAARKRRSEQVESWQPGLDPLAPPELQSPSRGFQ